MRKNSDDKYGAASMTEVQHSAFDGPDATLAAREAPSPPKVADAGNRTGGGQNDPGGPLARALEGFHEAVRALEGQVEARRRYDEDYLRRGVSMLAVEGSTPQILRSVPFLSSLETLGVKVSPKNIYIAPPELPRQN